MKRFEVVAGIIQFEDKILCMQRNVSTYDYVSYKYEFPGGKVEQGESKSQALMRELREEMEMETLITEDDFYMTVNYQYPDFEIIMHAYVCKASSQAFVRKEHINHLWLTREELNQLDWAGADEPIVKKLMME